MKNQEAIKLNKLYANEYIIYTRKSTDDAENQKNSIGYQIRENQILSQKETLPVARVTIEGFCTNGIIEEHHSGFKQDEKFTSNKDGTISYRVLRPKFLTLVDLLQQREFKGIICLCWDRLSRNEADDLLIKRLIGQGVDIRFVQADYEDSSSGALHMDIDGMFSRHYSRVISEKVRDSNKKLREDGKCTYVAPMGYLNNGSSDKPFDPERAPIVKRIFELYATGNWSASSLAQWASKNGLTSRPVRKQRTRRQIAMGVKLEDIPKIAKPVTYKSIESMLKNPFYIGKIVHGGDVRTSIAHQPLIDETLFYRVQDVLKEKTRSIHYPELMLFEYRGLVTCGTCHRVYTPYKQKGIAYYRSKCKPGCTNIEYRHINESFITNGIIQIMERMYFTREERLFIMTEGEPLFEKLSLNQDAKAIDLNRNLTRALVDKEYLANDKLNLLRTGVFTYEQMREEEARLNRIVNDLTNQLQTVNTSIKVMVNCVVRFSDLIQYWSAYFKRASREEKQKLSGLIFSELFILDGELKYQANTGYEQLLKHQSVKSPYSGSPDYLISELPNIYPVVKQSLEELENMMRKPGKKSDII